MWDLPGPGLEPVSPALAGGFSTTAPPGETITVFKNSHKKGLKGNNLQRNEPWLLEAVEGRMEADLGVPCFTAAVRGWVTDRHHSHGHWNFSTDKKKLS